MKEFYVGQDIVSIINQSQGNFKKGEPFVVEGLKKGCCKNAPLLIDIGQRHCEEIECLDCGTIEKTNINWYCSSCFRPLDELTNIEELTNVLENTKPFEINKHE